VMPTWLSLLTSPARIRPISLVGPVTGAPGCQADRTLEFARYLGSFTTSAVGTTVVPTETVKSHSASVVLRR